ncbi:hypothetical protein C0Q70_10212 [Pomacea canaliculata]|uniref:Uncharacterized protein n=1 Tax=Pomacea canaliculata TaxID=400727 RepID=A0A2T7PBZ2_POMCA|nr:hypothetical protein C0Q70_10212 [Pomacea canaliculata]
MAVPVSVQACLSDCQTSNHLRRPAVSLVPSTSASSQSSMMYSTAVTSSWRCLQASFDTRNTINTRNTLNTLNTRNTNTLSPTACFSAFTVSHCTCPVTPTPGATPPTPYPLRCLRLPICERTDEFDNGVSVRCCASSGYGTNTNTSTNTNTNTNTSTNTNTNTRIILAADRNHSGMCGGRRIDGHEPGPSAESSVGDDTSE